MNNIISQLKEYYSGDELIEKLTILPDYNYNAQTVPERLVALLDVYNIFIANKTTVDIYNRFYLALINSLKKKNTIEETKLINDNFRAIKGNKRYGVIGGIESFKITGTAGLGKTSNVQRCIDLITDNKVLVTEKPYREVIPILFVECVADGSFKSLLYSILQEVDDKLGTTYFKANKHQTTTVDILLAAVSNVLINHVAILVIDEIERVANDSKRGDTLINYLTQLVNQSNVAICFVGNESSNRYFQMKEYMSRRTIGISMDKMKYDESFYEFLKKLFKYQYTLNKVELNAEFCRVIYKLTNGAPSMIISLFVETQKNVILCGQEKLDVKAFEKTFIDNFSNMISYVDLEKEGKSVNRKKRILIESKPDLSTNIDDLFVSVMEVSNRNISVAISMLKEKVNVEFVKYD